jgi:O-antigen/teichoic acid export membrane protein
LSEPQSFLEYETPAVPGLGQRTSRGAVWMISQTLVSKVLSIGGQIALAWFLVRDDFALVGWTLAVASFPALIRDAGMQQILVQRQSKFQRWAGPVFWMSLMLGLVSGLVMVVGAPLAAHFYHAPRLRSLILLMAIGSPITALATVPTAKIAIDLRFGFQALLALIMAVTGTALNVILARLHFGAYAIILPYVLLNLGQTVALWMASGVRIHRRFNFNRWRYVVSDSGILLLTAAVGMLMVQGDYLTLGIFHNATVVGLFYFAFNLSTQTYALLSVNVAGVLFPALSSLNSDRSRQVDAFVRAGSAFAAIAIPICLLQAALCGPGIRLIFPKWQAAIPILSVLSIAMAMRTASLPATVLAAGQGRFRLNLYITIAASLVFLVCVAIGAKFSNDRQAPLVVGSIEALFFMVYDAVYLWVMLHSNGRSIRDLWFMFGLPFLTGAIGASAAALVVHLIPLDSGQNLAGKAGDFLRLIAGTSIFVCVYLPLLRKTSPEIWNTLRIRIESLFRRAS